MKNADAMSPPCEVFSLEKLRAWSYARGDDDVRCEMVGRCIGTSVDDDAPAKAWLNTA